MMSGIEGFFEPNPFAVMGAYAPLGSEAAAYYRTGPLARTLGELVDFDRLNHGPTRLSVGAAHVQSGEMRYFDSRDMPLDARHIMASGALPPAFPAIRIDGELYWDGGILSNTPVEAVFDDVPRRDSLVFAVHLGVPTGRSPTRSRRWPPARRIYNTPAVRQATSAGSGKFISCATSSGNWPNSCPKTWRRTTPCAR